MKNFILRMPIIITIILIVVLAWASFKGGSEVYTSLSFIILLAVAFIAYFASIFLMKDRDRPTLLIIISAGIILLGGLFTFSTSERTNIHLRKGNTEGYANVSGAMEMPFEIKLKDFRVENYAGTNSPMDFVSEVEIVDGDKTVAAEISMNNILKYKGYRFYQADYDEDLQGSVLIVVQDRLGTTVTYFGYVLLFCSIAWAFFSRNGRYRKILKGALTVMFLFVNGAMFSQNGNDVAVSDVAEVQNTADIATTPKTISKEEAEEISKTAIFHNERIAPLGTYSKDFLQKVYGKPNYKDFSATQVLIGWMFYPQTWQNEKMIKLKRGEYISLNELETLDLSTHNFQDRKIRELDEKYNLIMQLKYGIGYGGGLKIFPHKNNWYSANDDFETNADDSLFVKKIWQFLYEEVNNGNSKETLYIISKIKDYQKSRAEAGSISDSKINAELSLNGFNSVKVMFMVNFTFAILAFVLLLATIIRGRTFRVLNIIVFAEMLISFIALAILIGLRWYIAGQVPLAGTYNTLLFIAFVVLLLSIILMSRKTLKIQRQIMYSEHSNSADNSRGLKNSELWLVIPFAGLFLSGLVLLAANLNGINPKITSLMPVLNTPWLLIHVTVMMLSYALLCFAFILSLLYFIFKVVAALRETLKTQRSRRTNAELRERTEIRDRSSNAVQRRDLRSLELLSNMSKMFLYPGTAFMALGIAIGAVWANVSWGRYWGWDPKETWALITLLFYCLIMQEKFLSLLKKDKIYNMLAIIGILFIAMTYFGVNFFLSGMHAYN
ncbi:MAG: cytochrome c biogenesis protein CcsA [Bacteroidales bacterium]|jgi:cytochrome c-type biogenesis protein CcsB|nr:cytochrome c biogenesis protein CcsA [Bacteroidales bacterium]